MKTLIVEDDPTCASLQRRILAVYGPCDVAEDGAGALQRFGEARESGAPYDLVCLDVMMSGASGQTVLRRIRELEADHEVGREERTAVVMITALDDAQHISEAYGAQCDGYLVKPISRADLLGELKSLGLIASADAARVLIADDDRTTMRMLEGAMRRWGYDTVSATDGEAAWAALKDDATLQLALIDWMMPGLDGPEICERVRALQDQGEERYVYIVLLTGKADPEDLVRGMEAGADDYVVKPFNPQELRARLRAGRRIVDLHNELLAAKRAFQVQAVSDSLTGLLNRRAIVDRLEQELARARREDRAVSVIFMDLDHFKKINDTWGHGVGDDVLREFARRVSAVVRRYDVVGRFGGEEFLAIVPEKQEVCVDRVAERIRRAVGREEFETDGGTVGLTVSIGVATSRESETAEELIRRADDAMYRAKVRGRDQVAVAE